MFDNLKFNFSIIKAPDLTSLGTGSTSTTISGGDDNDVLVLQGGLAGSNTIAGGAGQDTVDYSELLASSGTAGAIVVDLAAHTVRKFENGLLVGTDTLIGIEAIVGSRYADTISGSNNAESLDGAGGNDLISGAAGNDLIHGGDGDDTIRQSDWRADTTIDGGSGVDTLDYSGLVEFGWGISLNLASGVAIKGNTGIPAGVDRISNIDAVVGTYLDDTLIGNIAANRLDGGDGRDTLVGDKGNDTVNGGAGDDYIEQNWDFESDAIDGGSGNDTVNYNGLGTSIEADLQAGVVNKKYGTKLAGSDTIRNVEHLIGTDFNDTLRGSDKADILGGNEGNDLISGAGGNDTLKGYHGNDTLVGDTGDDHLDGDNGNDQLIAGDGRNALHGGDGDDTIEQQAMRSNDTIDGGDGLDILDYSAVRYDGTDAIFFGLDIDMQDGTVSKFTPLSSFLKDRFRDIEGVIGSDRHDRISGNDGDNMLDGGAGKDTLDGGAGNDMLAGGEGNDVVNGAAGNDQLVQSAFRGNDKLDGGTGWDKVDYSDVEEPSAKVVIDLAAGTGLKYVNDLKVGSDAIRNIESVIGTRNDDRIAGSTNMELLDAGAGNDTLASGGGNDTLLGGDGDDRIAGAWQGDASLDGGSGRDVLDYSNLPAHSGSINSTLIINLAQSTVQKYDAGKKSGTDRISGFESLVASAFDDEITGDDQANTIVAGSGNDVINGRAGRDVINGGDGDDLVVQTEQFSNATIDGGNGHDIVSYAELGYYSVYVNLIRGDVTKHRGDGVVSVDDVSNIEEFIGTFQADYFNGRNVADVFKGNLGIDVLHGNGGDDVLSGDEGDDLLFGEEGNDDLGGGDGDDQLNGDAGKDNLNGGAGKDTLRGNDGMDYLDGGDGDDLLDGGADNDLLYGRGGDDVLTGGTGNNLLEGGEGDDIFLANSFSSSDTMVGGEGIDTVAYDIQFSGGPTATINANLATGKVLKFQNGSLVATDTLSGIEVLNGGVNNDTLMGSKNADSLHGNAGNDTINGGAGNDLLTGEGGDDRFNQFDLNSSDTFSGDSGIDTLDYSGLQGPAGVNVSISVLLKDGSVAGGAVKIQNGNAAGGVMDTVRDIEYLIGSKGDDHLTGNAANNRFEGGAGNDMLDGGAGNDTLFGGAGDDQFIQALTYDSDTFDGGGDLDQVNYGFDETGGSVVADMATGRVIKFKDGFERGTDTLISIELFHGSGGNDSISGSARAEYLNGQDGKDTINGLAGHDYLYGEAGDDILNGGAGNDFLSGDGGNDLYVFDRHFGKDAIENPNRESSDVDIVQFNDVTSNQVLFQRVGNSLTVSIARTQDKVTIDDWYALIEGTRGEGNINQFKAGGLTLDGDVVMDYVKIMGAPPVSMAAMLGAA